MELNVNVQMVRYFTMAYVLLVLSKIVLDVIILMLITAIYVK